MRECATFGNQLSPLFRKKKIIQFAYTSLGFISFFCIFFPSTSPSSLLCLVLPFICVQTYLHSLFLSMFSHKILKCIILTYMHWSKKSINCLVASVICRNAQTNTHICCNCALFCHCTLCTQLQPFKQKATNWNLNTHFKNTRCNTQTVFIYCIVTVLYCYIL